mmetsp:Transcript_21036/g.48587  ORF Transcript_21036/g.48587 Transcript_21036/m.48587 type:complete len:422 (-) Transcript_21036:168-1433(-)
MRFVPTALAAFCLAAASNSVEAFAGISPRVSKSAAFVPSTTLHRRVVRQPASVFAQRSSTSLDMSAAEGFSVGIVGATGAVGKEIRQCLEASDGLPVSTLRVFGSERSAGKTVETEKFGSITVELFELAKARECDVVFLAVGGGFSLEHAEAISEGEDGAIVIDNSSAFRYKDNVPLVVPEINGQCTKGSKLIANPNCTTAIGLMALWPLHKAFGLKKILMSTYQAASGAGQPGMDELEAGTRVVLDGGSPKNEVFAHPLPFNVIPHIDKFQENGYTKEEMKVTWESRKICGLPEDFPISCTAVRIPTIRAHSESIVVETEKPVDVELAKKVLSEAPGIVLVDDPETLQYPMPLNASGKNNVEVGRVRQSLVFGDHGLEFFVSGDQLLRGAALNAVLVAEEMVKNGALASKSKAAAAEAVN